MIRTRLVFLLWVVLLWGTASSVSAMSAPYIPPSPFGEHTMDVVGGGSLKGHWGIRLQAGYPWQALQIQYGLQGGWTPFLEVDSALFVRNQPSFGVSKRWIDTPKFRLTGEALLGWQFQNGDVSRFGPSVTLRLRMLVRFLKRFGFFLRLDTRHTFLFHQTVVDKASEVSTTTSVAHLWSPWAELGLVFAVTERVSVDLAFAYPWIDAPAISIPGFHVGVQVAL